MLGVQAGGRLRVPTGSAARVKWDRAGWLPWSLMGRRLSTAWPSLLCPGFPTNPAVLGGPPPPLHPAPPPSGAPSLPVGSSSRSLLGPALSRLVPCAERGPARLPWGCVRREGRRPRPLRSPGGGEAWLTCSRPGACHQQSQRTPGPAQRGGAVCSCRPLPAFWSTPQHPTAPDPGPNSELTALRKPL